MTGWLWIIIGIALCVLELLVISGFFLFLLGVSAVFVGLLVLGGAFPTWPLQAVVFCVVSLASWFLFGNQFKDLLSRSNDLSYDTTGKILKVSESIEPNQIGAGELWGSTWRIKNVGDESIPSGAECIVVSAEGVTLNVKRLR